jgi:hypothetical protein
MFKSVHMSHMRVSCKAKRHILTISPVRTKRGEVVGYIRPRSHKAYKAEGFRGKTGKVIKGIGGNSIRELRDEGGRR